MAGADFARVLLVVVEVLIPEESIFVANQSVGGDVLRVELDLDLDVLCDRDERVTGFLDEHLPGFVQRVEIGVVPVPAIRQLLHRRILDVAGADASTERKMPLARFSSISLVKSPWFVTPTLKSPSVARMTRLMPPLKNCSCATWYASVIPAAPFVEPPASSAAMAWWIVSL